MSGDETEATAVEVANLLNIPVPPFNPADCTIVLSKAQVRRLIAMACGKDY